MNELLDAVAASIIDEVDGADQWKLEKKDPMWRSPKKGKVLNVFLGPEYEGEPRTTGSATDIVEVIVEYAEPAPKNTRLTHDQTGEYAANAEARKIRVWALSHQGGFDPAWKMDWIRTDYTPEVSRELFVRYARITLRFEVQVAYA